MTEQSPLTVVDVRITQVETSPRPISEVTLMVEGRLSDGTVLAKAFALGVEMVRTRSLGSCLDIVLAHARMHFDEVLRQPN